MTPFDNPFTSVIFNFVPVMVIAGFVIVFAIFLYGIIKGIGTWNHNNSQPVLTVAAKVVSKRANVSRGTTSFNQNDVTQSNDYAYTDYYVTFQVESGDRMEFKVKGEEYGLLAEGDLGKLTFQGTRYLGYERNTN